LASSAAGWHHTIVSCANRHVQRTFLAFKRKLN
jgi:hypothetical protein